MYLRPPTHLLNVISMTVALGGVKFLMNPSSKNSIVAIHNPTLRFLAKWLAMVVYSRTDLRLCSSPELQCLSL